MFKVSRSYQRPENALKRANEFIDVNKPNRALEVLYEVIKRGKMRTNYSEKLLEPIMFKYLELCVDLKKSHLAKEGLYQYRNIFQSVNVSSLETVVRFYLQLADDRTESARQESHQAVVDIDDLDNLATPEEILLSAVSGEDAQDRSDRTILTPWVKFLWESYRQCLELLRTNSRVEKLYHNIAQHAFKFCEKYNRKTEFRKLCDNLRTHLSHIQKQQGSATAVNLNNPETQQMNLETRLEQLNYAIKMELWQEAYKAIEDISDLMKKSKKMPRPSVMASYYQKLALVFWKAGNHLFHAAALFKLFQLLRDQKKNVTLEEISKRASIVLVAILAIPLPSAHPEFDRFIETEKSALEKIEKLAMLLSLPKPPTRISLIRDLVRYNVVNAVPIDLQNMYQLMENEFDPLHLCHRMQAHLDWIKARPESGLPQYVLALQEMTITRLVKQVAQIYQTITFARLLELSIFITPFHLERILVDLVRHNDLQIRIDHRAKCIHFGVDLSESQREDLPEGPTLQALPSETIRCQLVQMSSALQKCVTFIAPESKRREMEPMRAQTIQMYQQTRQRDHQRLLQRQHIIEERKEMLENQNLEREEQQRKAQQQQLKKQKEEEQERLRREASKREKERQEEQMLQIQKTQIKDKILQISKTTYGQKMIKGLDEEELLNLGAEEIMQRQVEELEKERKELQKKLKAQEKTVDYFERAKRLVEIPRLKKQLDVTKEKDKEAWKMQENDRVTKLVEEHKLALAHSTRLKRMKSDKEAFMDELGSARKSEIQKKLNDFNTKLETQRKIRLEERKKRRHKERKETHYRQKEELQQQRREEELKKQREMDEQLEAERMKEEEEGLARKEELKLQNEKAAAALEAEEEGKSGPWRPKKSSLWRQKDEEKRDVWRAKEEEKERVPLSERLASRDIRCEEPSSRPPPRDEEPPKEERSNVWRRGGGGTGGGSGGGGAAPDRNAGDSWRGGSMKSDRDDRSPQRGPRDYASRDRDREGDREPVQSRDRDRGDFERGPPRDYDRGAPPSRDRDREFERGPPRDRDRDFERGPAPRDFERGSAPAPRDFERAPPRDRDQDFERGPPRDRDRDFERGPPRDRDRDFERGPPRDRDRDFERGPPRDRDFERRPQRDFDRKPQRDFERGPARDFERGPARDFERGPARDFERGPSRDFERGQGRDIERGPSRDFERGQTRDFERGQTRDFERGPPRGDRDREFTRGSMRGGDRDFERGGNRGDFARGNARDRDFERAPAKDFERGPVRGPPRDKEGDKDRPRELERAPQKEREFTRGAGPGPAPANRDRPVRFRDADEQPPPPKSVWRKPDDGRKIGGGGDEGRKQGSDEGRKQGSDEGRKQGSDEGRKQGSDEGRKQGSDEGRKQGGGGGGGGDEGRREEPKKVPKKVKEEPDEEGWTTVKR